MNRAVVKTVVLMVFLLPLPCGAHPHVFLYSTVTIVFDDAGLAGFRVKWRFDEMFSSSILLDFDKNGNKRFEPPEIQAVEAGAFANLKQFNYFMHVRINGKPFEVQYVTDFSAAMEDDKLVYRFFVPCHVTAIETFKQVSLSIYDQTYYSSVFWADAPVAYKNADAYVVNHHIEKNKDEAYYYGQVYPEEVRLRFRQNHE